MANVTWWIPGMTFAPSDISGMVQAFRSIYGAGLQPSQIYLTEDLYNEIREWSDTDVQAWVQSGTREVQSVGASGSVDFFRESPRFRYWSDLDPQQIVGVSPIRAKQDPWSREYKKQNSHLFKKKKR